MPGAGSCDIMPHFANNESCLTAADIVGGRSPDGDVARTRGAGCKNDGGPLWITVELQDDQDGISGADGGGTVPMTVYGRIFQKKQSKRGRRRRQRDKRYA